MKAQDPTGSAKQDSGDGAGQRREQPGKEGPTTKSENRPNESSDSQSVSSDRSEGGQAGSKISQQQPGSRGSGLPNSGGQAGKTAESTKSAPAAARGADDPNLEFTRKQVDLALEHLKDQLAKEKPDLLEQLGWSRDEARRFLENWRKRVAAAQQEGARGQAARNSLEEALKSLGLRPHGTQLKGSRNASDQFQNLRDAGQSDPPSDWADLFRAYTKSVAGEGREAKRQGAQSHPNP